MDLQLSGKTALVTGSTAGIGYAIAERLAREGARAGRDHGGDGHHGQFGPARPDPLGWERGGNPGPLLSFPLLLSPGQVR